MAGRNNHKQTFFPDVRGQRGYADRVYIQNVEELTTRSAFGEVISQELTPITALNFVYGVNSGIAFASGIDGGTITSVSGMASVDTTASANSEAFTFSRIPMRYLPGQAITVRGAGVFTSGTSASGYALLGAYNSNFENALMFGTSGSTFGILYRSFNEDVFIPQSEWNGIDIMDGNSDGEAIDPALGNVYQIQYEWLGFGGIEFSVMDPNTGRFINVHTIKYGNTSVRPSLSNPSMHIGAWAKNNGDAAAIKVRTGSMGGFSAGPKPESFNDFHTAASGSHSLTDASIQNVITVRNNDTFNGLESERQLFAEFMGVSNDGNKPVAITVIRNATLTGASFEPVDNNRSSASVDLVGSGVTAPSGDIMMGALIAAGGSDFINLFDLDMRLDEGESFTIAAEKVGGGSTALVTAFIRWREEI